MNAEINSKITVNMNEKVHLIELKYKDIILNLFIANINEENGLHSY